MELRIQQQGFNGLMHRPKRKVPYNPDDSISPSCIIGHSKGGAQNPFEGLIKRFYRSLIQDDGGRISKVSRNEIAASHKLKSEGFRKIKIDLKLIPLHFLVLKFSEFYLRADVTEVIQSGKMVGHGDRLDVFVLQDRILECGELFLRRNASVTDGEQLTTCLVQLGILHVIHLPDHDKSRDDQYQRHSVLNCHQHLAKHFRTRS